MTRLVTVRQGTVSACGPLVGRRSDGTVCVLIRDGDVFCGRPIGRHIPEKVVKPAVASDSGYAMGGAS